VAAYLNRNLKTTWVTYNKIREKKELVLKYSDIQVPLGIFKDRRLSILEALVKFLRDLNLKYSEIARLLSKDQRTIWTVNSRVQRKLGENEYKK
jgi:hypothetical protein